MASRPKTSQQKAQSSRKRAGNPPATSPSSNKTLLLVVGAVIVVVVIAAVYLVLTSSTPDETNGEENNGNTYTTANPVAVFNTTMGTFKIELFEDKVPNTVANFVQLVNDGFYDGMNFYRISDDFMIQAGRYFPDGSESQSPYGTIDFEANLDVLHVDGAISMARSTDINSASAEFFICDGDQRGLDDDYRQQMYGERGYTAFGITIEGLDVVHEIAAQPNDGAHPAGGGKPDEDIIINSITIENLE